MLHIYVRNLAIISIKMFSFVVTGIVSVVLLLAAAQKCRGKRQHTLQYMLCQSLLHHFCLFFKAMCEGIQWPTVRQRFFQVNILIYLLDTNRVAMNIS